MAPSCGQLDHFHVGRFRLILQSADDYRKILNEFNLKIDYTGVAFTSLYAGYSLVVRMPLRSLHCKQMRPCLLV